MATRSGSAPGGGSPFHRPARSVGLPGWLGPVALLTVLAVALVVGSGVLSSRPASAAERAHALETTIRCPSCLDVSVADSSAATAASLRHQILLWERQGVSDQQIDDRLVARYGPSILLSPPARGLTVLVWVLPAVAGAVALAAIGVLFWRRSRAFAALAADRAPPRDAPGTDGAGSRHRGPAATRGTVRPQ